MPQRNATTLKRLLAAPLFWIVLTAAALRIVLAVYQPPDSRYWADEGTYHALATHLIAGNGFTVTGDEPSRVRTPGYPVFLALIYRFFGTSPQTAVIVQAVLCSLSIYLVFRLAETIFNRHAAYFSALIAAAYPALIYYDTRLLREGLTGLLLVGIALLAFRFAGRAQKKHFSGLGLLLAAVSMVRPETLIMGLPATCTLLQPDIRLRRIWRPAFLVALPIVLVWVPWTARNQIVFGSPSPITAGVGATMWFGNQWSAIGGEDRKDEDHARLHAKTTRILKQNINSGNEANVERTFMSMLVEDLKKRPGWFASMIGNKMVIFWKDANGVKKTLPGIHPLLAEAVNIWYYLLLTFGLIGFVLTFQNKSTRTLAFWIVTYMMIYALLHVRNRYRVPILPVVFVLSAGGLNALWDLARAYMPMHRKPHLAIITRRTPESEPEKQEQAVL